MSSKILIGSPVRQKTDILREFLQSLTELNKDNCDVDYFFIDDCNIDASSQLLSSFHAANSNTIIVKSDSIIKNDVCGDYDSHNWDYAIIDKVALLKNKIIAYAVEKEYDYLFLIDSDIVMHTETLQRLLSLDKDIVSNIFWTKISRWDYYEPQVWMMDQRSFYDPSDSRSKNRIFRTAKHMEFIHKLKEKGTYKVGGLGACTLISRKVLVEGVNFSKLYNISFWGEDRAFCIRAVAAGFELYVDTYYPAYHIYRECYLKGVADYKKYGFDFDKEMEELSVGDRLKKMFRSVKIYIRCGLYNIMYKDK